MPPPLAGLTILSLAEQYPGPYATLILADLGARVILVERPSGDPSRANPAFFESLNRSKLSVALDLRSTEGRDAFLALVAGADAVIEGFRPGAMARLGLGYDELHSVNPTLVYLAITGFGQSGPYAARPGHDLSFQALAGALHDRLDEAQPGTPWLSLANLASGAFAAVGVLTALVSRSTTGQGVYVDLAMLDSVVSLLTVQLTPILNGAGRWSVPPEPGYGLFRAADGRVLALSIYGEDDFWRRLCVALELSAHAHLTMAERQQREPELRREVAHVLSQRPLAEWERVLEAEVVPFATVNDLSAVPEDPQLNARGMFVDVDDGGGAGPKRFVRQPLTFDGVETGPHSGAPSLGANTKEVLAAAGCSAELIRAVLANVAAQTPDTKEAGG